MLVEQAEGEWKRQVERSPCLSRPSVEGLRFGIPVQGGEPRVQRHRGGDHGASSLVQRIEPRQTGGDGRAIAEPQAGSGGEDPRIGLVHADRALDGLLRQALNLAEIACDECAPRPCLEQPGHDLAVGPGRDGLERIEGGQR